MKTKTISIDISTISKSEDIISLMDDTAPTKKNEKISLFFQGNDYNRPANKNLKTTLETFKEKSSKYNIDAIQMLELNI
ncbi:MAG: hypothetical protein HRU35_01680 [Rickettsiaceae bacterium]|nr:hypothetical protein [Rickettsiaceae bacterium]